MPENLRKRRLNGEQCFSVMQSRRSSSHCRDARALSGQGEELGKWSYSTILNGSDQGKIVFVKAKEKDVVVILKQDEEPGQEILLWMDKNGRKCVERAGISVCTQV